ncbi:MULTISPECIES: histidine phosphatase family protein [Bremerella]|uniref:histidine phosphatase family protein n=1 Tax=Bremerella TaxID=2714594 RepID=UPI0031E905A1
MSNEISADTCWMFLVRHGATEFNLNCPSILQGNGVDGPLADIGRRQAAATGEFLSGYPFDAVYSSPMKRAQETAGIIAPDHSIVTVPEIIEADVGRWLNRDWHDIEKTEPEEYRKHLDDPSIYPYPGGESATDVANRAVPKLTQLLHDNLGKRILVVAHYIVIRVMIASLYKTPLKYMRMIHLDNCGVTLIKLQDGEPQLLSANSAFHLQDVR